jgi:predicted N-acetyltransferase YhbS
MVEIRRADIADAEEIHALVRTAFLPEAEFHHMLDIYPLRQTLEGVRADFARGVLLKAVDERNEIVGSIRALPEDSGAVGIHKLVVRPDAQGKKIGSRLLSTIESYYPGKELRLIASVTWPKNEQFYLRAGYAEVSRAPDDCNVMVITFRKQL